MLQPMEKLAIFLLMIGLKKASSMIGLMDSDEIQNIVPKLESITEVPLEIQEKVWSELVELGYEDTMGAPEALVVIRMLFNGGKIANQDRRRF